MCALTMQRRYRGKRKNVSSFMKLTPAKSCIAVEGKLFRKRCGSNHDIDALFLSSVSILFDCIGLGDQAWLYGGKRIGEVV